MSRENPGETLTRVHLYLDGEDTAWYKETFGQTTGLSKAIRAVLRSYRKRIEAQAGQSARRVELPPELKEEILRIAATDQGGDK